jgi:hypothetical protein
MAEKCNCIVLYVNRETCNALIRIDASCPVHARQLIIPEDFIEVPEEHEETTGYQCEEWFDSLCAKMKERNE